MADDIFTMDGEDDPNRCQASTRNMQCTNKAVPGGKYCRCHGGNKEQESMTQESLRNYRLTKWHAKLGRHAESPGIKSLRDEIAILRMLLEERLNICEDANDLILQSHMISDLVVKVENIF